MKTRRRAFPTTNNPVGTIDRIHAHLFFQTRYLLNEVNVKIKLTKYTSAIGTMSPAANASKVHILGAIMYMRKVKLSPSVFFAHAKTLENSTTKSRSMQDLDDSECGNECESR